jgi:hypothetical protein
VAQQNYFLMGSYEGIRESVWHSEEEETANQYRTLEFKKKEENR